MASDKGQEDCAGQLAGLLNGYQSTALIYCAAKLGIADILGNGPCESVELAASVGAHAPSLHRILRALVVLGVCTQEPDGRFGLSDLGKPLLSADPKSLLDYAIVVGEEYFGAWQGLMHSVTTGEPAFTHVFGVNQWEHRRENPELGAHFDADLGRETARAAAAVIAAYDFSRFETIADIGGGRGALLSAILGACPGVRGVLFDRSHVVKAAKAALEGTGAAQRIDFVDGDFFSEVPGGADVYILKSVLHDWNDEKCALILANCRKVVSEGRVLLVIERLMPEQAAEDAGTVMVDLQMLTITGGLERSESEYRALFEAAGLTLERIIPTRASFGMMECVPG